MKRGIAFYMKQEEFNLETALEESKKYTGFTSFNFDDSLLKEAVDSIL